MKYDPQAMIDTYREAFRSANGRDMEVSFEGGWFTIGAFLCTQKVRRSKLEQMTATLLSRAALASGEGK
jgi:hypothetical protein